MGANTLLAIKSTHKYADRRAAIRSTWLPDLTIPHKFILGLPAFIPNRRLRRRRPAPPVKPLLADELQFHVDDSFRSIAPKIQATAVYALANGFHRLVICDDDTFCIPARLQAFLNAHHSADVYAYLRPDYPQGSMCVYGLHAIERLAVSNELVNCIPDDVAVGRALQGMIWQHTEQFQPGPVPRLILRDNDLISTHKALPVATRQTQHSIFSVNAMWKGSNKC
jgi:hypothetical protein